jgi:hypothetical protein
MKPLPRKMPFSSLQMQLKNIIELKAADNLS